MSSINYFDNLYKSCIKKINDYDFNNDVNLHNFINFINEDDYNFHFDYVLKNYLPTFFKFFSEFGFSFIYSKNINNYILTHVPESSINVFVDSLDIFIQNIIIIHLLVFLFLNLLFIIYAQIIFL